MSDKTILSTSVDARNSLRVLKSDIGYHFELLQDGKLTFGTYFKYGESINKVALCLGGAVYGMLHDDELSEDVMKVVYDNQESFGGNELSR